MLVFIAGSLYFWLMNQILTILSILLSLCSFSQNKRDTIYFDRSWNVTKILDSAQYYRLIRETDGLYRVTDYYIHSDSVQMTGAFRDYAQKEKEGEFVYYAKNGLVTQRGTYRNGKRNGLYTTYYSSGEVHYTEEYADGEYAGDFTVYYRDGIVRRKETYKNGKQVFKACYLPSGKKTKYFPYEEAAMPKGGMEALKKYLKKNIHYPPDAYKSGIEGRVYVQFVVSKTGEITHVKIKKSVDPLLDEEALRVVKALPAWKPGMIDGEPVNSLFNLPVTFSLSR
jgi:TonB family protein